MTKKQSLWPAVLMASVAIAAWALTFSCSPDQPPPAPIPHPTITVPLPPPPTPDETTTTVPLPPPPPPAGLPVVRGGAFCSSQGARGVTTAGTPMVCTTTSTDSHKRWRAL